MALRASCLFIKLVLITRSVSASQRYLISNWRELTLGGAMDTHERLTRPCVSHSLVPIYNNNSPLHSTRVLTGWDHHANVMLSIWGPDWQVNLANIHLGLERRDSTDRFIALIHKQASCSHCIVSYFWRSFICQLTTFHWECSFASAPSFR